MIRALRMNRGACSVALRMKILRSAHRLLRVSGGWRGRLSQDDRWGRKPRPRMWVQGRPGWMCKQLQGVHRFGMNFDRKISFGTYWHAFAVHQPWRADPLRILSTM